MNTSSVRIISFQSEEYELSLQLRHQVLRVPLGLSLFDEDLLIDEPDVHIAAFVAKQMVGVMLLKPLADGRIKMRQVAVTEGMNGKGIGTQMIKYAEKYCRQNNYTTIVLNARETAVDFYLKNGYHKVSDTFFEVGIAHVKMKKTL